VEVVPAPDITEKNSDPSKVWTVSPGGEVTGMSMSSIDRVDHVSYEEIHMDPLGVLDDDGASEGALQRQSMNFLHLFFERKGIPNFVVAEIDLFKKPFADRFMPVEVMLAVPNLPIEGKSRLSMRANKSSPLKLDESPRTKAVAGHVKKYQDAFDIKKANLVDDLQKAIDDSEANDGFYGLEEKDLGLSKQVHWTVEQRNDLSSAHKLIREQKKIIHGLKQDSTGVPHDTHKSLLEALENAKSQLDSENQVVKNLGTEFASAQEHLRESEMARTASSGIIIDLRRVAAQLREEKHELERRADVADAKLETYKACMPVRTVMKRKVAETPSSMRMKIPRSADVSFEVPTPGSQMYDDDEFE
jgi:hypothetical protein